MADESTPLSPKSLADAESFEEFKALASAPKAAPVQQPETEEKPAAQPSEPEQGETAAASGTPKQETQEKPDKKRAKTAEARAEELAAQGRYEEARKILEGAKKSQDEEFSRRVEEEIRKRGVSQAPPPAPEPPKPAEPKPAADGKPNFKEIRDRIAKDPKNASRLWDDIEAEAQEEYGNKLYDWRENQRKQEEQARTIKERLNRQGRAAMEKHPDFPTVCSPDAIARVAATLSEDAQLAIRDEAENGAEVLYSLISNPAEAQRIAALPPKRQVQAILSLDDSLAKPPEPAAPPEKPSNVRPITRLNPPAKHVLGAGITPAEEKPDPTDPNYERWKQAEAKRTKRA